MDNKRTKVAIDIGYGFTKYKFGDIEGKKPTAISIQKTRMINNIEPLIFEGKKYCVGDDALTDAIKTRDYTFILKYSPLIIYDVLKDLNLLDQINDLDIHTGLSLYDLEKAPEINQDFKNRKEEFIDRVSNFTINNILYTPNIKLYAQGTGAWFDYCNRNGFINEGVEVVVDIGYRTNDIIIFKDGSPSKSESNADDKGVNLIVNELRTQLNKKYDITLSEQEVVKILNKKEFEFYGQTKDLTVLIDEIIDGFFDTIFSSLKADYGNILKSSKRVIISGGGAYILKDYANSFPPNVTFDKEINFEYANVRGYYNG